MWHILSQRSTRQNQMKIHSRKTGRLPGSENDQLLAHLASNLIEMPIQELQLFVCITNDKYVRPHSEATTTTCSSYSHLMLSMERDNWPIGHIPSTFIFVTNVYYFPFEDFLTHKKNNTSFLCFSERH